MTGLLLDTHVLVWLLEDESSVGPQTRAAANRALAEDGLFVSAISFWEVAMLQQKGRLALAMTPGNWRRAVIGRQIREIPVDGGIGMAAVDLPRFHADPADRMIVATAQRAGMTMATADGRILDWDGPLDRLDARQ
ncbi:MAG: type II toxin-antitoxin system VapC family toxin [Hyphomicrobiales bacterium]|nr:type II toxin-antitoxin system VapC family toxin [Hyphomicrobiales bacterium]MCP5370205.1 type II toxin-antitoxin system VapC family toxin [Hyphomicrobiales bacterium]